LRTKQKEFSTWMIPSLETMSNDGWRDFVTGDESWFFRVESQFWPHIKGQNKSRLTSNRLTPDWWHNRSNFVQSQSCWAILSISESNSNQDSVVLAAIVLPVCKGMFQRWNRWMAVFTSYLLETEGIFWLTMASISPFVNKGFNAGVPETLSLHYSCSILTYWLINGQHGRWNQT
jgi:hypothetical protein